MKFISCIFIAFCLVTKAFLAGEEAEGHEEPHAPHAPPKAPQEITTKSGLKITTLIKPEECTEVAQKGYKVSVCYSFTFFHIYLDYFFFTGSLHRKFV